MKTSKLISLLFVIAVVVFTITFSIALPIYIRPFYYAHVEALDMAEEYNVDKEDIIDAYDEVLDFLTKDGREFGTGFLAHSEEGKGHFEDCKVLFDLNKYAFIISVSLIVLLFFLDKLGIVTLAKPKGLPLSYYAGVGTLTLFGALGIVVAKDFQSAFTVFHKIFFPGKENWLFNPYEDPIILFMPQEFFMDCAILICASILVISIAFIARGIRNKNLL